MTSKDKLDAYFKKYDISLLDQVIINFIYVNFILNKPKKSILQKFTNKVKKSLVGLFMKNWKNESPPRNSEFGFDMFKDILNLDSNSKLSDYFSVINTKSDLIDFNFIAKYDSYKADIVKEFSLSKSIPKDLQGETTVARYIFEMMKRVFEGVYITRSLFSLKFLFDPEKKNISKNLEEFTIAGINDEKMMRFGMKVKKCNPDLSHKVKCLEATGNKNEPLYTQTQANVTNNRAKNNFVVLPLSSNEFKYKTSFYNDIKNKNFKNCLIGVISDYETLPSKVTQQIQSLKFFKKI